MKIVHLFHDLMNLYGEYANILAIQKYFPDAVVETKSIGDEISLADADVVYIGSGTEKNQKIALKYLINYKEEIENALKRNVVFLATGNSYEMFGKSVTDKNGTKYDGLGIFDFYTEESDKRTVTDAVFESTICEGEHIGFVNKASEIYGIKNPMFVMKTGAGNNKDENTDGICEGSFYGTHIIGPVLIRNKALAKSFCEKIKK